MSENIHNQIVRDNGALWDQRYLDEKTGWDMNQVSPPLQSYFDQIDNKDLKILIPGCGTAYEAEYLLDQGFENITLLDISGVLVEKLRHKFSGSPVRILQADFFDHTESYDLIIEQTLFCAIDPALRKSYVQKMHSLLNADGILAGLLFNTEFANPGPPFGGSTEEYKELFESFFNFIHFEECRNSIPQRQGRELFIEFRKKELS